MLPGDLVAGRFEIERLAGSGGMGTVYRARDGLTGEAVALKVLRAGTTDHSERFAREARVLAEISHPGIVRHVAHGTTPGGEPYLAMEWLEGESLSERLSRQGTTTAESLAIALGAARALAPLHRRGIVHRDLKPGNLFLVEGSADRLKLLDFGIARLSDGLELTRTGAMLGSPGYVAPEQARGEREVDARADVFSLGCVLFRCLAGRPPFAGQDALAVMLRVVLEDTPRLRDAVEDASVPLDALLARMMAKSPADRPDDAEAVAVALAAIDEPGAARSGPSASRAAGGSPESEPPTASASGSLTTTERRVVCFVLARPAPQDPGESPTLSPPELALRQRSLLGHVERHRGRHERLGDGTIVVTLGGPGAATDLAARGARCALDLRELLDGAAVALVIGKGVVGDRAPGSSPHSAVGEAIERGARLLAAAHASGIRVDEDTAALLDTRFELRPDGAGLALVCERDVEAGTRTLLGKPTPCIGRDRELAALEAIFDEVCSEPVARAVLVTAPAGVGKSRLRYELVRRLERRGTPVVVWIGRGDPMSAGSPLGLLADALRRAFGLRAGEPADVARQKLGERLARRHGGADLVRISDFLGELLGLPPPEVQSMPVRAAKLDAMLMGDQMRRAWEDLCEGECAETPLVLVLEDLHWGDLPSVTFVDSALRRLSERPLLVVALARLEVHELFPKLWSEREVHEMRLTQLTPRSSERLVRAVLGDGVSAETARDLAARAGGNAFYLEELIRAAAEGRGDTLPESVLAMVEARLARLDPEARRLLRAGSVFGQVFWEGGVVALAGAVERAREVREWLDLLVSQEVVTHREAGKFPDQAEYVFRHALVREAAYSMLTDEDRRLGHQLAAEWLERVGESDALVLAEHFERGSSRGRAGRFYLLAAQQALGGNDFLGALACVERALGSGPHADQLLGALLCARAEAHRWRGETSDAGRAAAAAMERLSRGTAGWYNAVAELGIASGKQGDHARLDALAASLIELGVADPGAPPRSPHVVAASRLASQLLYAGRYEAARVLLAQAEALASPLEPAPLARLHQARALEELFSGDTDAYSKRMELAAEQFEQVGDLRNACMQRTNVAFGSIAIGQHAAAERALREALSTANAMGLRNVVAYAQHNLGLALARENRLDEARAVEAAACAEFERQGDRRLACISHVYLAEITLAAGDRAAAEVHARAALDAQPETSPSRPYALAMMARVMLADDRAAEALAAATEAVESLESIGGVEDGDALARLTYAEALRATGDIAGARTVVARARELLVQRAARINDGASRRSFLESVPENRRTIELAEELE